MDAILEKYEACVDYYCSIMTSDDVLLVKDLFRKIPRASCMARKYLHKNCRTLREFRDFFSENSHLFFVENGRVALYNEELELVPEKAEKFFEEILLEEYEDPVLATTLKKKHLGKASDEIDYYFARFYPCKEFEIFFKLRPDLFVLKDHSVFLIEVETVRFFKRKLKIFGKENLRFMDFRGHVGQAPPHIRNYIHRNFFGDDFQIFLRRNSDVFALNESGHVSLVSPR